MSNGQQGSRLAYGELIPKIEPDDADGKPVQLTIRRVREQNMARPGQRDEIKLVIEFAERFKGETPDKQRREYIVNSTSYKTLCLKLGTDHARWEGKPIVMAPTNTEYGGETFEKMHVASPDRWDKVITATAKARAARSK
jgi:hypothetical protein